MNVQRTQGGTRSEMVFVTGNGHGDPSSNSERFSLHCI